MLLPIKSHKNVQFSLYKYPHCRCIVFARYDQTLVDNREFFMPYLYLTPSAGWPSTCHCTVWCQKTRTMWLLLGSEQNDYTSIHSASARQTDRRTERENEYSSKYSQPQPYSHTIPTEYCASLDTSSAAHPMKIIIVQSHQHKPPSDWKWPIGRPSHTWLFAIEADLKPLNIGLSSAWKKATNQDTETL